MNNTIQNNNIIIDDNNIELVSKKKIKDALIYVGLQNIITISHKEQTYKPPFHLNTINKFNRNAKIEFNCKCSKLETLAIRSITERILNNRSCAICNIFDNNTIYNDIINQIPINDIVSFSKEETLNEFINIDIFSNSVDHQKQLKKHDKIQLKCSVNGCDRLRNCRVCKIFDEKPFNQVCSSCTHKLSYKKMGNVVNLTEGYGI